jgi:hypothetical protein
VAGLVPATSIISSPQFEVAGKLGHDAARQCLAGPGLNT